MAARTPSNPIDAELLRTLTALAGGRRATDLESPSLDFKEDSPTEKETFNSLRDAAICFANSLGGVVIHGVNDKGAGLGAFLGTAIDPQQIKAQIYRSTNPPLLVEAHELTFQNTRLVVVRVPESPEIHADPKGRALRRVGTDCLPMGPSEQMRLREERRGIDWSAIPSDRTIEEIQPIALDVVRRRLRASTDSRRNLARLSDADLLSAMGLVNGQGRLRNAGAVLLCAPRSPSTAIVYQYRASAGGEPSVVQRLTTPLVVSYERAVELAEARLNMTPVNLPNGQQIQIFDFPPAAIREALANAVIHRDYHQHDPVHVEHSPTVFTVVSPGPLVIGVTPENILTHPSKPRNPTLAAAARTLGFAEETGRGVDRIYREMITSGGAPPSYVVQPDSVRVALVGTARNIHVARYIAQLPEHLRDDTDTLLILYRLCTARTIDADEIAPLLQRTGAEAEQALRSLASDDVGMLEATRESARKVHPQYRLRTDALRQLGPAIGYQRRTVDDIDRKVIAHVREYKKITNKTIQNLLDVNMWRAADILSDLVTRGILTKTSEHQRGPGVEYGAGSRFPHSRKKPS